MANCNVGVRSDMRHAALLTTGLVLSTEAIVITITGTDFSFLPCSFGSYAENMHAMRGRCKCAETTFVCVTNCYDNMHLCHRLPPSLQGFLLQPFCKQSSLGSSSLKQRKYKTSHKECCQEAQNTLDIPPLAHEYLDCHEFHEGSMSMRKGNCC